jgi:hypothetical protein
VVAAPGGALHSGARQQARLGQGRAELAIVHLVLLIVVAWLPDAVLKEEVCEGVQRIEREREGRG